MKTISMTILIGALCCLWGCGQSTCQCTPAGNLAAEGQTLQTVSTEFQFTEGPAADKDGNVYFTDQPNDRIMIYTTDGRLETFMQPAGRSNGLYFDKAGNLLACADEKNELWQIDIKTKQHKVLAQTYDGKLLNAPNDLWVRPDGGIYFTDPFYKRTWWNRGPQEQSCQGVYYLSPGGTLIRVAADLQQPNGIIGTPDGKTLYVADIKAKQTWRYRIQPDGTLADKQLFCSLGSDGMTIDCCGNVYLTGSGVTVFNSAGIQIHHIDIPQKWTANITFGGSDRRTLFVTASTGIYTLKMNVCGVQ